MRWFFADGKDFISFVKCLQNMPNSVYTSEFVQYLFRVFWEEKKREITKRFFYPYLINITSMILYLKIALDDSDSDKSLTDRPLMLTLFILTFLS